MADNLSDVLKEAGRGDTAELARLYDQRYGGSARGGENERKADYKNCAVSYYDLVSDLYEYGWGASFHFAPRKNGESVAASLARYQHYLAERLNLRAGMVCADLGCGIGGPQREITRVSGARIVGVNSNGKQIERARKMTDEAGLSHLAEYIHCDFMQVEAPDGYFDAVYGIQASEHAPNLRDYYGEVMRLLKPGGCYAAYEYSLTNQFDPDDPIHSRLKEDMEYSSALPNVATQAQIVETLLEVGFDVMESRDLATDSSIPPEIPWYEPLVGSGMSLNRFRSSAIGRRVTHGVFRLLESLRLMPSGTTHVTSILDLCANVHAEMGRLGIFSPMFFVLCRKPE